MPTAEATPVPDDDLSAVVEETIFRMHLDHNQPQPGETHLMLMAVSWREHLAKNGIPWHAVPMLYDSAVSTKSRGSGRGFMPAIGDLLFEWDKALEAGYWEKQNVPEPDLSLPALGPGENPLAGGINTDNAPEFVKEFSKLAQRGIAVTCHCDGDKWCQNGKQAATLVKQSWGSVWICAQNKCDFNMNAEDLSSLVPRVAPKPQPKPEPPPPRKYSADQLLASLEERCKFSVANAGEEVALLFAKHLETVTSPDLWTNALARGQWQQWNRKQKQEAAA